MDLVPLPKTEMPRLRSMREVGEVEASQELIVTVHLLHKNPLPEKSSLQSQHSPSSAPLTFDEFHSRHRASRSLTEMIASRAREAGFRVLDANVAARWIRLAGTPAECETLFGVQLKRYQSQSFEYFGHDGPIYVPKDWGPSVQTITGLDNLSTWRRTRPAAQSIEDLPSEIPAEIETYFPVEVASLYDFPPQLDGTGQTIGIVSLGGQFALEDLARYFELQKLPMPHIEVEEIDGEFQPHAPSMDDLEVTMDLEIAGSLAPGAKLVVYRVNSQVSRPCVHALKYAIHEARNRPNIVSISYGAAEDLCRAADLEAANQTLEAAALMGITVCVASGDAGSASGDFDSLPIRPGTHVNFPASSPFVLACGGTTLDTHKGRIVREAAWNDLQQCRFATSGGISRVFRRPEYQQHVRLPANASDPQLDGRGVPDVAANAALTTAYKVVYRGELLPNGGTSAAAPLWAALVARLNQGLGRPCGFLNPLLYRLGGTAAFQDIVEGRNGAYVAGHGWDACTGLGRPSGQALLRALRAMLGSVATPEPPGHDAPPLPPGAGEPKIVVPKSADEAVTVARDAAARARETVERLWKNLAPATPPKS